MSETEGTQAVVRGSSELFNAFSPAASVTGKEINLDFLKPSYKPDRALDTIPAICFRPKLLGNHHNVLFRLWSEGVCYKNLERTTAGY